MPGQLQKKADKRALAPKRKPMKIIVGDAAPTTDSFVKERTIKLDPKVKGRGTGKAGVTIGGRKRAPQRATGGVTRGMGGRR